MYEWLNQLAADGGTRSEGTMLGMANNLKLVRSNGGETEERKQSGRAAGSFSGKELDWLDDALKYLVTGRTRKLDLYDQTIGVGVARKVQHMRDMAAKDAATRSAHAAEVQRLRQEKLNEELSLATMAVVDTKAAAE